MFLQRHSCKCAKRTGNEDGTEYDIERHMGLGSGFDPAATAREIRRIHGDRVYDIGGAARRIVRMAL